MDAKANTHFCVAPITQVGVDTEPNDADTAYLIVVGGGIPGTMHPVDEFGTSLGRSAESSLQFNDITVSRKHARVSLDPDGVIRVKDEGSTNGTFVNGHRMPVHSSRRLKYGDRLQLGSYVVLKVVRLDPSEERFQREMFERTVRDSLTGLYNRAYFNERVGALAEQYSSHGIGMAILMIDVDHFKCVNDDFGHVAGDGVLKEVATVIRESTRAEDLVARFGGEEFVVALPVSDPELATARAERIRRNLAARAIGADPEPLHVTISIGLAFNPPARSRNESALILRADQALYKAKAGGRNRVVFGHPDTILDNTKTRSAEFASVG